MTTKPVTEPRWPPLLQLLSGVRGVKGREKEWRGNDCNKGKGFIYLPQIWWDLLKTIETISDSSLPGDPTLYSDSLGPWLSEGLQRHAITLALCLGEILWDYRPIDYILPKTITLHVGYVMVLRRKWLSEWVQVTTAQFSVPWCGTQRLPGLRNFCWYCSQLQSSSRPQKCCAILFLP